MEATVHHLADVARVAGRTLVAATSDERSRAVIAIAAALIEHADEILDANAEDMERAKKSGMAEGMQDRLLLTLERIESMAEGARSVAQLPEPLGKVLNERTLPNGLHLKQISVPFGVVGMVYEARPNVTVDAAVILLKSGNTALLRGSSSAAASNSALIKVMRAALQSTVISPDVIQNVPSEDRSTVGDLLHARGKVDLVIPRGSAELIRRVVDDSSVPTIETGAGVCHVYVDDDADLTKAVRIVENSKTQRLGTCNTTESLLVSRSVAKTMLPKIAEMLVNKGMEIRGCAETCILVPDAKKATEIGRAHV